MTNGRYFGNGSKNSVFRRKKLLVKLNEEMMIKRLIGKFTFTLRAQKKTHTKIHKIRTTLFATMSLLAVATVCLSFKKCFCVEIAALWHFATKTSIQH